MWGHSKRTIVECKRKLNIWFFEGKTLWKIFCISIILSHSFVRIWCNKRIEIKRVCRLQMKKKFMSMKKNLYLRSSANFLFFFYFLLKFDITFSAHGIKMRKGERSSYHERKIFCTMHSLRKKKKNSCWILFYFIYLWHLHMVKLFAIFLIHFYNAFLSSSILHELLIRYMQYDLMPKVERVFWI